MGILKNEYLQYLKNNFKGLIIKAPLFFNWPIGLRFDLQKEELNTDDDKYFDEVTNRATLIFNEVFKRNDEVYILYMDYKWKRRKIRLSNYLFKQISDLKREDVEYSLAKNLYEKGCDYNLAIVKSWVNKINNENIFKAIANTDFPPRQPRVKPLGSERIYFINATKAIVFHMYDDRGLDVIATDKEVLKPLSKKYSDWVLNESK